MRIIFLIIAFTPLMLSAQTDSIVVKVVAGSSSTLSPELVGASALGKNVFIATNPSGVKFFKIMDNDVSVRTAAEMLLDIGAASASHLHVIGDVSGLQAAIDAKQSVLVSGTNIKTINGASVLGSGDLVVSAGAVDWADITNKPTTTSFLSSSADKNFVTDAQLTVIGNTSGANTGDQDISGLMVKDNNLSDLTNASTARTNLGVNTTANIASSANKNFVTDAQLTTIGNTSGTNTGDNAANTTYANDYRAANFVAGTDYLAPNGSAANLTNNNGGWTTLRVSGSNATTTGQVLVDITGLVSATLSNSTKYEIEVLLSVTTSNVTTGITYGIATGGTGGASVVNAVVTGTTTAVAATSTTINTAGTKTAAFLTASSISGTIRISGFVTTRGSGTANISIQHSKETSGTSTVITGSVFRYRLAQ